MIVANQPPDFNLKIFATCRVRPPLTAPNTRETRANQSIAQDECTVLTAKRQATANVRRPVGTAGAGARARAKGILTM